MSAAKVNYPLLLAVGLATCLLAAAGMYRLKIDTDVARSLPVQEQVIVDALDIFQHHPIHDQVAVDVAIDGNDPDLLVDCGAVLEERMRASGLFAQVGTEELGALLPDLALRIARGLPHQFSRLQLETVIAPRLEPAFIRERLQQMAESLGGMEGIGQAAFFALDPLGFKDLVMARMAQLAPTTQSRLYRGRLLAADGQHLLVTARPRTAGTDTAAGREITRLLAEVEAQLIERYSHLATVKLTPVGAYRAALDNEELIRHDVQLALLLSTLGIALLLLVAFPRPLLGLLSLVPALAGTAAALFVYSLFHSSISIMVLGFGGALLAITVDHGIAYLLYLDQPRQTRGRQAAREVRSIGSLMALLTTVGALLVLSGSGFPVFAELGQFTALGFLCTYLFVHTVFPRIFPVMPPASARAMPLHALVRLLTGSGKAGAVAALLLALGLGLFARPEFHISLESMSTVREETLAADRAFSTVWGDLGARVYLMLKAGSIDEAQRQGDRVLDRLEEDIGAGRVEAAFVPAMLFPGPERGHANLQAWRGFWTEERRARVGAALRVEAAQFGFAANAFDPFLAQLDAALPAEAAAIPSPLRTMVGMAEDGATGGLVQFITVSPGKDYDAAAFFDRYGEDGRIFDAAFFGERLAALLFSTFTTMLLLIAAAATALLFLQHANWQLPLITLLPSLFALVCTLGTLRLVGHPLDIPGLMLAIVIFGMGIDYAIYTVGGYQWYGDDRHPSFPLVGSTVFMAGASTLIGFGVLCFAEHALLRSVGITSLCGIAYSLLGVFLLLPPLLRWYFSPARSAGHAAGSVADRVRRRYRTLEAYPRMFARFKLRHDPLFRDLPRILAERSEIRTILDLGCGYGVPACWCLEQVPGARITGLDPDPDRVRVAARAFASSGTACLGAAPRLPAADGAADVILLLDMLHYLDDQTLGLLLTNCRQALAPGGIVVVRFVIDPPGKRSWAWRLEDFRVKRAGLRPRYYHAAEVAGRMVAAGLAVVLTREATDDPELVWVVGRAGDGRGDAA